MTKFKTIIWSILLTIFTGCSVDENIEMQSVQLLDGKIILDSEFQEELIDGQLLFGMPEEGSSLSKFNVIAVAFPDHNNSPEKKVSTRQRFYQKYPMLRLIIPAQGSYIYWSSSVNLEYWLVKWKPGWQVNINNGIDTRDEDDDITIPYCDICPEVDDFKEHSKAVNLIKEDIDNDPNIDLRNNEHYQESFQH